MPTIIQPELDFGNADFWNYHRENPKIYEGFKSIALQAIGKGYKHFSAEACLNILRWQTDISAVNDDFKINNNYRSYYARLFEIDYPEHKDFFRKRGSKADSILNKAA